MRPIVLIISIILFSNPCISSEDNAYKSFISETIRAGHRNIGLIEKKDTLYITYWPIGFRDDYEAFKDIRRRVIYYYEQKKENRSKTIELVQTSWGIPIIKANIEYEEAGSNDRFTNVFKAYPSEGLGKNHYKSRKFFVLLDIPLAMKFGGLQDPFVFKTGIRPDFRFWVHPGVIAYSQVDLYVHNEFDPKMWYKPADMGLMVAHPLSEKILSITNVGSFTHKNIYGIDEEIKFSFFDGDFSLGLHLGLYGDIWFNDNRFKYTGLNKKLEIASLTWSYWRYDCSLKLKGGRFLNGDKGAGIEISRVFYEVEIGFSGIYSGNEFNGYIDFSIPLFPKSRRSLASNGIAFVRNLRYSYRYNSKGISHDPNETEKGVEPEVGISFREIEGLARPVHFRHMYRLVD